MNSLKDVRIIDTEGNSRTAWHTGCQHVKTLFCSSIKCHLVLPATLLTIVSGTFVREGFRQTCKNTQPSVTENSEQLWKLPRKSHKLVV